MLGTSQGKLLTSRSVTIVDIASWITITIESHLVSHALAKIP
ncbi:MAG: hypothetical protein RMY16_09805 [Nostoc sp. DedQUE12b]|nr:hypothetical protein [Nostoc sp. DedQUE12b]MDZ8085843.1 hypothetical protein [Nostoc sp. DedQUE12b]